MRFQRGLSLSGLMVWAAIFAVFALLAMRIIPPFLEYGKIVKAVKTVASDASLMEGSVEQVKVAYVKRMQTDDITALEPGDLDISKENGRLKITAKYVKLVPLAYNVSLHFDFEVDSGK